MTLIFLDQNKRSYLGSLRLNFDFDKPEGIS